MCWSTFSARRTYSWTTQPCSANCRIGSPRSPTYPVDLPQNRKIRLIYPLTWFRAQHVPLVAERVQVDTYVACQVLSEAMGHAFGDVVPDYIIEQIENMVSLKLIDGYFPRLGLAPGQRFASKGGYIVQLTAPDTVVANSDWLVP
jgi:hypothetical protein